jgi:hypothetical protein
MPTWQRIYIVINSVWLLIPVDWERLLESRLLQAGLSDGAINTSIEAIHEAG